MKCRALLVAGFGGANVTLLASAQEWRFIACQTTGGQGVFGARGFVCEATALQLLLVGYEMVGKRKAGSWSVKLIHVRLRLL